MLDKKKIINMKSKGNITDDSNLKSLVTDDNSYHEANTHIRSIQT